jgi:hypothetical protein
MLYYSPRYLDVANSTNVEIIPSKLVNMELSELDFSRQDLLTRGQNKLQDGRQEMAGQQQII